ncbi:MAG: TraX family protein, partial [Lachnospiraceae bacterium]|nr:TraX family protein [Lachnospiraceae bacterium]
NGNNIRRSSIARALILLILVGAEIACTDYGAFGILLILLFYHFRGNKRYTARAAAIAIAGYSWLNGSVISGFALLAIPFILLYNGKKGRYPLPSLLFYAAYPIHLLILGILLHGM